LPKNRNVPRPPWSGPLKRSDTCFTRFDQAEQGPREPITKCENGAFGAANLDRDFFDMALVALCAPMIYIGHVVFPFGGGIETKAPDGCEPPGACFWNQSSGLGLCECRSASSFRPGAVMSGAGVFIFAMMGEEKNRPQRSSPSGRALGHSADRPGQSQNGPKTHCADFCAGGNRFSPRLSRLLRQRSSGLKMR
jgi:hypothetical protein